MTEVKDVIRMRRKELGLSYEELGKKSGCDKSTVRKWELGHINNMRRDKIIHLSQALDISPLILLGMEEFNADK